MTLPTPFSGLLHHLRNAYETTQHLDYNLDSQWSWIMSGQTTMPNQLRVDEIELCSTENTQIMLLLADCIERLQTLQMNIRDDFHKALDERNLNNAKWREVHGLPPLEESE